MNSLGWNHAQCRFLITGSAHKTEPSNVVPVQATKGKAWEDFSSLRLAEETETQTVSLSVSRGDGVNSPGAPGYCRQCDHETNKLVKAAGVEQKYRYALCRCRPRKEVMRHVVVSGFTLQSVEGLEPVVEGAQPAVVLAAPLPD